MGGGGLQKTFKIFKDNEPVLKIAAGSLQAYNLVATLIQTTKLKFFQPPSMDIIISISLKEAHTHRRISIQCVRRQFN
jgi:hypothetical protein